MGIEKTATTVKGSGEPRSGLYLRGEEAEQNPSWPRPSSDSGTLTR